MSVDIWIDAAGAWNLSRQVGATTQTSKSANGAAVLGTAYHVQAVFPAGANHQLYVNGAEVTLIHTGAAINGALTIASTDEIAIGDPTDSGLAGMAGKIGRVTLWPFAVSATRAAVAYRHQSDATRWVGISGEDQAGETNQAPVAVPFRYAATAGSPATINVRARAYDPNGDTMSIVAGSLVVSTGTASISGGDIVATPPASAAAGSEQTVQFDLQDTAGKRSRAKVYGTVSAAVPVGAAYSYYYKYPEAASLDVSRIIPWPLGTSLPAHNVGDTILAYGDTRAMTGDEYAKGSPKGSLVYIGGGFEPTPRLYGADEYPKRPDGTPAPDGPSWGNREGRWDNGHSPARFPAESNPNYKPYMGVNNLFDFSFDATAQHHTTWEVEPGLFVNWPITYICNAYFDYEKNACNFGDIFRSANKGSLPNDATTKALRGRKTIAFFNKCKVKRAAHYCDQEVDATGKHMRNNAFHFDGLQTQLGLVGWRVADCEYDWIMGQNFFCGLVPGEEGFPRTIRQKYANVVWKHSLPWAPATGKAPSSYCPQPDNYASGSLQKTPRIIMNSEGMRNTAIAGSENSDYDNGAYWAVLFERSCYIKSKWPLSNADNGRHLAPGGNGGTTSAPNNAGILTRPKTGTSGQYTFSNDVKPTHNFPAWACAPGATVTLMDNTQTPPTACPDSHTGPELRVTTAAAAAAILKA